MPPFASTQMVLWNPTPNREVDSESSPPPMPLPKTPPTLWTKSQHERPTSPSDDASQKLLSKSDKDPPAPMNATPIMKAPSAAAAALTAISSWPLQKISQLFTLYLTLSLLGYLFSFPIAHAADYAWEEIANSPSIGKIVSITVSGIFTAAAAKMLHQSLIRGRTTAMPTLDKDAYLIPNWIGSVLKLDTIMLKPWTVGPTDEGFGQYMTELSTMATLTKEGAFTQRQKEMTFKGLVATYMMLLKTSKSLEEALTTAEELQKDLDATTDRENRLTEQVALLSDHVKAYEKVDMLVNNGSILGPVTTYQMTTRLQGRADLTPLLNLWPPSRIAETDKSPEALANLLRQDLGELVATAQKTMPAERIRPWQSVHDFKTAMANYVNTMGQRMSMAPASVPGNLHLNPEQCHALAMSFPTNHRPEIPLQADDLLLSIQGLAETLENTEGCNHPYELSNALDPSRNRPWEESIATVRNLVIRAERPTITQPPRAPPPEQTYSRLPDAPGRAGVIFPHTEEDFAGLEESKEIKQKDLPIFDSPDRYWEWRSSFLSIANTFHFTSRAKMLISIRRVLGSFQKDCQKTAQTCNPTNMLATTWARTVTNFIQYMDERFLPATFTNEMEKEFNKVHPRKGETGKEFLRRFENAWNDVDTARACRGEPQMEDSQVKDRLMQIIPAEIRNDMMRKYNGRPNSPLVSKREFYESLSLLWDTRDIVHTKANPVTIAAATSGKTLTPASQTPAITAVPMTPGNNDLRLRKCGKKSSYDSPNPAVPNEFRGPLYHKKEATEEQNLAAETRNTACRNASRCESCRRPRGEHGTQDHFMEVKPFRRPA